MQNLWLLTSPHIFCEGSAEIVQKHPLTEHRRSWVDCCLNERMNWHDWSRGMTSRWCAAHQSSTSRFHDNTKSKKRKVMDFMNVFVSLFVFIMWLFFRMSYVWNLFQILHDLHIMTYWRHFWTIFIVCFADVLYENIICTTWFQCSPSRFYVILIQISMAVFRQSGSFKYQVLSKI